MEFHFLQTDDGSPSLKLGLEAEAMHSSKGAFSETTYIYGQAVSAALAKRFPPSFLSLGLGLGYNELLTTGLLLQNKSDLSKVRGESFELVSALNENFAKWLTGDEVAQRFKETYDQICSLCAQHTNQQPLAIRTALAALADSDQWKFNGALAPDTQIENKISCFLFDAFSSKTSPELWSEDFVSSFLSRAAADQAILSTYACTGTLKRALTRNGFEVSIRPGFAGKRESIFATRGVLP